MALIPGSYARAAGLQSEINKVTVTRVAGSELQFRRTIDTYQKDLRYNVNHIRREQRQLRRSMRRYCRKLHQGKKERAQRQEKLQEQERRLRRLAEDGQRLLPQILTVAADDEEKETHAAALLEDSSKRKPQGKRSDSDDAVSDNPHRVDDAEQGDSENQSQFDPNSPEEDRAAGKGSPTLSKTSMWRNKASAYLRPHKDLHKDRSVKRQKTSDAEDKVDETDGAGYDDENGESSLLPSIAEEEEQAGQNNPGEQASLSLSFQSRADNRTAANSDPKKPEGHESPNKPQKETKLNPTSQTVALPVLDTKSVQRKGSLASPHNDDSSNVTDVPEFINETVGQDVNSVTPVGVARSPGQRTRGAPERRRTGVSYGDLIKLQHGHSTSTKRLFNLVDRLASKHGIVDPPADPSARKSRFSSLDPRSNSKIKQRGQEQTQSRLSDRMVKEAAILYSIKYGYAQPDEEPRDLGDISAEETDAALAAPSRGEHGESQAREDNQGDSPEHHAARSVDFTRESRGHTAGGKREALSAAAYKSKSHNAAASGDITSLVPATGADGKQAQNNKLSRGRHAMSMLALSQHVSTIKNRSVERQDPGSPPSPRKMHVRSKSTTSVMAGGANFPDQGASHDSPLGDPVVQKLSPLPAHARPRRNSIQTLLQERLQEVGTSSNGVAWQSAFGRLKMVHTLVDLSPYFVRDGP